MSSDRVTAEQRRLVVARAKSCCEYCVSQVAFSAQSFSVEHIIPRHKSGPTSLDNLALACQGCNGSKRKDSIRLHNKQNHSFILVNIYGKNTLFGMRTIR